VAEQLKNEHRAISNEAGGLSVLMLIAPPEVPCKSSKTEPVMVLPSGHALTGATTGVSGQTVHVE
jgi:hypothetical protein